MNNHKMKEVLYITPFHAMRNYVEFTTKAKQKTLSLFSDFKVYDGNEYFMLGSGSLIYYLFHPHKFIEEFLNNRCKLWFLKNIIRIPLPYVKILNTLKKFDK